MGAEQPLNSRGSSVFFLETPSISTFPGLFKGPNPCPRGCSWSGPACPSSLVPAHRSCPSARRPHILHNLTGPGARLQGLAYATFPPESSHAPHPAHIMPTLPLAFALILFFWRGEVGGAGACSDSPPPQSRLNASHVYNGSLYLPVTTSTTLDGSCRRAYLSIAMWRQGHHLCHSLEVKGLQVPGGS